MIERFEVPRRKDWSIRFIEFLKDSMDCADGLNLDWEYTTCTSFSGEMIEAITGKNPYEDFMGTNSFTTILGAVKTVKAAGFKSLDDIIAALFKEVPVGMAQQGDLVLVKATPYDPDSGDALVAEEVMPHGLAVVDPPFFYCVTEAGLSKGDLYTQGVRAFAVGREV